MIVAAIGIIINTFTAWLFMAGRKENVEVTHEGDHAAVAIVLAAEFGV